MIKVTEGSGTNCSNLIDIEIEEEEEEEGNKCFNDEVLDLRQRREREVSLEQTKKRTFMVGFSIPGILQLLEVAP